jgi:hypothetical protein
MEAAMREGVLAFDGRVLEIFEAGGSVRFHPRLLPELWVDGDAVYVRQLGSAPRPWAFDAVQREQIELLVLAVAAARADVIPLLPR